MISCAMSYGLLRVRDFAEHMDSSPIVLTVRFGFVSFFKRFSVSEAMKYIKYMRKVFLLAFQNSREQEE
jgi:hypothetical protein